MAWKPDENDLPEPLVRELGELYRADIQPSPERDRLIVNSARAYLTPRRRFMRFREIGIAAAAVILLALILIPALSRTDEGMGRARVVQNHNNMAGDLTGDKVVDIRDAMLLQKMINGGVKAGVDVNKDGVTDQRDVDAIAAMAVKLQ